MSWMCRHWSTCKRSLQVICNTLKIAVFTKYKKKRLESDAQENDDCA